MSADFVDVRGFECLSALNGRITTQSAAEFAIHSMVEGNLILRGGFDLCYYHTIRVEFIGVSFIELPTLFNWPFFELASAEESTALRQRIEMEGCVVKVYEDAAGDSSASRLPSRSPPYWIVANEIRVTFGTVRREANSSRTRAGVDR